MVDLLRELHAGRQIDHREPLELHLAEPDLRHGQPRCLHSVDTWRTTSWYATERIVWRLPGGGQLDLGAGGFLALERIVAAEDGCCEGGGGACAASTSLLELLKAAASAAAHDKWAELFRNVVLLGPGATLSGLAQRVGVELRTLRRDPSMPRALHPGVVVGDGDRSAASCAWAGAAARRLDGPRAGWGAPSSPRRPPRGRAGVAAAGGCVPRAQQAAAFREPSLHAASHAPWVADRA